MTPWSASLSAAGGTNWPIAIYAALPFPFLEGRSTKPLFWSTVSVSPSVAGRMNM